MKKMTLLTVLLLCGCSMPTQEDLKAKVTPAPAPVKSSCLSDCMALPHKGLVPQPAVEKMVCDDKSSEVAYVAIGRGMYFTTGGYEYVEICVPSAIIEQAISAKNKERKGK